MVKPKKHLGQHFLHDKNIAKKIVSLVKPASSIIEVGAGTGILSTLLYELYKENVWFTDIDEESISYLIEELPLPQSQVLKMDILEMNFSAYKKPIHIIGNFPYNISSQIFFKILENRDTVSQVVCMIQKEVAERIATKEGSKTYGILSVLLQAYYNITYHFTVNEQVFFPPPKVKSAVVELKRNNISTLACNEKLFFTVVKMAFNQRRKMLSNSLSSLIDKTIISPDILKKRPEQLSVNEFILLTQQIENQRLNH
jgi:16S rRNA (adenine1518-N6/adenine1519-N6)-dimethyltransferase